MRLALISCVSKKQGIPMPAKDLYISDMFKKSYAYTSNNFDKVLILSAKYGVIDPTEIIEPYDLTLNTFTIKQKKEWALNVFQQLQFYLNDCKNVYWFAGDNYRKYVIPFISNIQHEPLKGLGIGKQLQFYKNNT